MKRFLLVFLLFITQSLIVFSQDYYWVGGGGNWSDINHWATSSGGTSLHAVVPGPSSNVIFDVNSGFVVGNNTVFLDVIANCRDMTWVGAPASPIISGDEFHPINVYGSWELQNGMSYNVVATNFRSNIAGETLTTSNVVINGGATFEGDGGWTFMDNYTDQGNYSGLYFLKGNLNTNGSNLNIKFFNSYGNTPKSLSLGSSEITIRESWEYVESNHTLDAGTSHIILNSLFGASFLSNSNLQYHNITFSAPLTNTTFQGPVKVNRLTFFGSSNISHNNEFDTLILASGNSYTFESGRTQIINDLLEASSLPCSGLIEMRMGTLNVQAVLQFGINTVINIDYALMEGMRAAGNIPVIASNSFDMGANTNFIFPPAAGQTLYWVGGAGDWNDANHWSLVNDGVYPPVGGGCIPTPLDDVVFNYLSGFTTGNNVVVLDGVGHYCHDMTWVGAPTTPEITGGALNPLNVYGSWSLQNGMSYKVQETNFRSNDLGETLTTNGTLIGSKTTFNGDGSWTFMDDYTDGGGNTGLFFIKGNLYTNENTLNINRFVSVGNNLRFLSLSSSEIIIRFNWDYIGNNHAVDAGTSHLIFTGTSGTAFKSGMNLNYYNVTFQNPAAMNPKFIGSVKLNKLTFLGGGRFESSDNEMDTLILSPSKTYAFEGGRTQTINLLLEANSPPCSGLIEMSSSPSNGQSMLHFGSNAVVDINSVLMEGLRATGNIPVIANNSYDMGGNVDFIFPPATGQTLYWVGGAGDWNDASHWSLVNDGVYPPVGGGCVPTPLDDVVFNSNSGFTIGDNTVALDGIGHYCRDMTWLGAPASPDISGGTNNPLNIYGSWTLQSNMSYGVKKNYFHSNNTGETLTTNGVLINGESTFEGNGSWTFMDDYTDDGVVAGISFYKGSLYTNGNNLNINRFRSGGSENRFLDLASSEITTKFVWDYRGNNHAIDAGTSHLILTDHNGAAFKGNLNQEYHHITFQNPFALEAEFSGPVKVKKLTFLGGSFFAYNNEIDTLILSAGKSYKLQNGQTQTITAQLYASGNPCFILFMSAMNPGFPANLNVLGGSVNFNYASVQDINAIGSYATLEMGPQSTDNGNNQNFTFAPYDPNAAIGGFDDQLDLPCPLTPFTLHTNGFHPNPNTEFLWGDGSTADSLEVSSFGTYTIRIDYGEGCIVQDTVDVTPYDIIPPVIANCPSTIVQSIASGNCQTTVTWLEPTATDECMFDSMTSVYSPGDVFSIGTTTVTYLATDVAGNTETCSFEIIIVDNEPPVILDCPTDITLNNEIGTCGASATWTEPTATDNCAIVSFTSNFSPGDVFPVGTTTVTYTATDASGNVANCSFDVIVIDNEAPIVLSCPVDITQNNDAGSCGARMIWNIPTFTDNCSVTITSSHNSGTFLPVGTTTVIYTATDPSGNSVTCSFDVTIIDNEAPTVDVCPVDIVQNNDTGNCSAVVSWTAPVFMDNCSVTFTNSHSSGDVFPVGTTTVVYTATDVAGNTTLCSFDVTVVDNKAPVFNNCPNDITLSSGSLCDINVTWTVPTATDNCTTTPTLISTHNSGDNFPVGTTEVVYTATDAEGNVNTCSFNVTVEDDDAPTIVSCVGDTSIYVGATCEIIVLDFTMDAQLNIIDVCSSVADGTITLTQSPVAGTQLGVGTHMIEIRVEDAGGNFTTCSFELTVADTIAPVIEIDYSDTTIHCEGEEIIWTEYSTDNCGVHSVVSTHESGSVFPVGTTTVTYTATDVNGNVSAYSFDVIVNASPETSELSAEDYKICYGKDLILSIENPDDDYTYSWILGGAIVGTGTTYGVESSTFENGGTYTVVAESSLGCYSTTEIVLEVESCSVVISGAISPNGDGLNDVFEIEGLEAYPNTEVWIYNRWGTEVFYSEDYQNDWDGTSQSSLNVGGNKLPEGTYYYIIKLGGFEGQPNAGENYKGYVYLKR